jgi:hypothetical protein
MGEEEKEVAVDEGFNMSLNRKFGDDILTSSKVIHINFCALLSLIAATAAALKKVQLKEKVLNILQISI